MGLMALIVTNLWLSILLILMSNALIPANGTEQLLLVDGLKTKALLHSGWVSGN